MPKMGGERASHQMRGGRALLLVLLLVWTQGHMAAAPKGKTAAAPKLMLGRPGTNLKAGLVGLPNVGKSSFFNVLCSMQVAAENYPFCTIDPSISRVEVQDERFEWLCEHFKPASKVRSFLTVTDIAGLVKGAAEGAGLGNAFLSHIQAVDCVFHVVRAFDDADVTHVEDSVDPVRDLEIIAGELLHKDTEWCRTRKDLAVKKLRNGVKAGASSPEQKEVDMCTKILDHLEAGKVIRMGEWSAPEIQLLNSMQLLTAKQCVVLVNLSEDDYIRKKNKWLPKIKAWLDAHTAADIVIPVSVTLEAKLAAMSPEEKEAYCADNHVQTCLPKVVQAGLKALNMQCFFTAGADEVIRDCVGGGFRSSLVLDRC